MNGYILVTALMKNYDGVIRNYIMIEVPSGKTFTVPLNAVEQLNRDGHLASLLNAEYDTQYKGLVGKNGFSLSTLPVIANGKLNRNIMIAKGFINENGQQRGLVVSDIYGKVKNLDFKDVCALSKRMKPLNFSIKQTSSGYDVKDLYGFSYPVYELTGALGSNSYNSGFGEKKAEFHGVQEKAIYAMDKVTSPDWFKDVNSKMFIAISELKKLSPYYWFMISNVDRVPCDKKITDTMAVSESKMYWNPAFVRKVDVSELVFVFIHEMMHICMQHVTRCGNRNAKLWNYATDLYINETILREFNLSVGIETTVNGVAIKVPDWVLYMAQFGEVIDLAKDIPEILYTRLEDKANNEQQGQQGNSGQSSSGGQSGSGSQSGGSQSSNNQGSGQGGDSKSLDDFLDEGSDNSGGSQSSSGGSGSSSGNVGGSDGVDNTNEEGHVTYNGKVITGHTIDDMVSETGTATDEQRKHSRSLSQDKLQDFNTKRKIAEDRTGQKISPTTSGAQLAQRFIDFGLSKTIDWHTVLKNMCKYEPKKMFTYAQVNQNYSSVGVILPDRVKNGKKKVVTNIKICIDVSGSISDETLKYYLSEVANIFSLKKVVGELIYWSTEVGDSGEFRCVKDLTKVKPNSTGGTDIKCLFDYLVGKRMTKTGKKEQTKPEDIIGIIILTDGAFDKNYGDYAKTFGKKTLFIIDGSPVYFEPLFGRVVGLNK